MLVQQQSGLYHLQHLLRYCVQLSSQQQVLLARRALTETRLGCRKSLQEGIENIKVLMCLIVDTYNIGFCLQSSQQRENYLLTHQCIRLYAAPVQHRTLNEYWYSRIVAIFAELLNAICSAGSFNQTEKVLTNIEKIKAILIMYPFAVTFSKQDIFSYSRSSKQWSEVRAFTNWITLASTEQLAEHMKMLAKGLDTVAAVAQANYQKGSKGYFEKAVNLVGYGIENYLSSDERQRNQTLFRLNPNIDKVRAMWNLPESHLPKLFMKMTQPYIQYVHKIYLPRDKFPVISETAVLKWATGRTNRLLLERPSINLCGEEDIFTKAKWKARVRIICCRNPQREKAEDIARVPNYPAVILHIHGGGFVSLSSRTHQTYTRRWARECGIPVFSIDYAKAPEHPYPQPLNDCWQAYCWLRNEAHNRFRISPFKRIVLAGDSSGGNLCLALTSLCIQNGVQPPDAIASFYPAANLSLDWFTPSFLQAFDDPLLFFSYLIFCQKCYIQNPQFDPSRDYFISPLFTPDSLLQKFPTTRIFVGTLDPLHDDAVRLALRLFRNKVQVRLTSYENMPHAFLSMDVVGGVQESARCVQESIDCLNELIRTSVYKQ